MAPRRTNAWERPYRPGMTSVAAWSLALLAGVGFVGLGVPGLVTSVTEEKRGLIVIFALAAVWFPACIAVLIRAARAGIYTSSSGVQVRNVFRTRTVPWSQVEGFSVVTETRSMMPKSERVRVNLKNGGSILSHFPAREQQPSASLQRYADLGADPPSVVVGLLEATMSDMSR